MPNNVIYAIYPDDFENLWMSSDYGIIKMNKTTFAIENFLPKNGVGQTEFNRTSHFGYRDEKGNQRLFFGGLDGITAFYPKDFQDGKTAIQPQLVLLSYQQFSGRAQNVVDKTIETRGTNKIVIKPNDYISELEVGLLNYEGVNNNQYFYQLKMNGRVGEWQSQKSRMLQLGQLPYGRHQLLVKGVTISNLSAANELNFEIIVKKPFYLTWWFISLFVIGTIALIFYWLKWRTVQYQQRQKELESLVDERTEKIKQQADELKSLDKVKSRFFANVSHELRTPLTLMLGPIGSTLKKEKLSVRGMTFLQTAQLNGKKLLQLINEILDLSKLESGKLELQNQEVVLYILIRRIVSAFESYAQKEEILFTLKYEAPKELQVLIDANKIEIIINNLLSNALKFTPSGVAVS